MKPDTDPPRKVVPAVEDKPRYTLEELLQDVTDDRLHPETDTGPAVGAEVW